MTMTTVLLIDDQPIILEGCRRVLEDAGIGNVIQARNLVSGYRLYYRHHPDVIIIDLNIRGPELRGLSLIRRIGSHGRRTRILIFSMNDDPAVVTSALEAGASGYLLKDSPSEELVKAVEQVRAGMSYLSHQLVTQIVFQGERSRPDPLSNFAQREIEVLTLLVQGKRYALIAEELGITYKTVVNITSRLRLKLGVSSLPELIRKAVELLSKGRP
jgi:two-component system, NarL family, invasion response regulator UvrY